MKANLLPNCLGLNPYLTVTRFRLSLGSNLSRFSLASLICLCMLTVGVGNVWGASPVTFTTTTSGGFSNNSKTIDGITVTMRDGTEYNTTWQSGHVRVYAGGGVTFSSSVPITQISFTCTAEKGYSNGPDKQTLASGSPGSYSTTNGSAVGTWSYASGATSIVFNATAQIRITQIVVTYTAPVAEPYTVRFYTASGIYSDIKEASASAGVTPPVMSTPCDGWAFQGWSKSQSTSSTSTTVLTTETLTAGKYYPSANTTLYPVYTKTGTTEDEVSDEIVQSTTGLCTGGKGCSTTYTAWSNKALTSDARYAGQSYAGVSYIQIRNSSPSGVISTTSGGILKSVEITWNSGTADTRYVTIYGKTTAYTAQADLYDDSKRGTSLGTIIKGTSTSLDDLEDDEYTYVGIKASNPIYIDKITITWIVEVDVTYYYSYPTCCTKLGSINGSFFWTTLFEPVRPCVEP